jgi:hypothetical protein
LVLSSQVLVLAAAVAAVILVVQLPKQLWPIVAAIAAGLELLIRFGILRLSVRGVDLWLILGIALAVAGGMTWMKSTTKVAITAAAVVAFVGLIQVASSVGAQ